MSVPTWRVAGFVMLLVLSLGVSVYAVAVYSLLPLGAVVHPDMRASFETHRLGVIAHVFASAVALVVGPLQFLSWLRVRRPVLHRWLGRIYLGIGVLIGGLAGLSIAPHAFGGLTAQLGFTGLALSWLYTGWRAYRAIRTRDVDKHRRWMVRNFALTFAAVTLRIWLPASVGAGIAFELAYPVIAWACWVPNIVIAELLFNRQQHASAVVLQRASNRR